MNTPARLVMRPEDFLTWEDRQERKYELVDGVARLMAGGSYAHVLISQNIAFALRSKLGAGPCRAFQERRVTIPRGHFRYPDVVVDCGRNAMGDLVAAEPRIVFEVESPSNRFLEAAARLEDFQSIPSVSAVVVLSQDAPHARLYAREGDGWAVTDVRGLEAALPLEALQLELPLAELYAGVAFEEPTAD